MKIIGIFVLIILMYIVSRFSFIGATAVFLLIVYTFFAKPPSRKSRSTSVSKEDVDRRNSDDRYSEKPRNTSSVVKYPIAFFKAVGSELHAEYTENIIFEDREAWERKVESYLRERYRVGFSYLGMESDSSRGLHTFFYETRDGIRFKAECYTKGNFFATNPLGPGGNGSTAFIVDNLLDILSEKCTGRGLTYDMSDWPVDEVLEDINRMCERAKKLSSIYTHHTIPILLSISIKHDGKISNTTLFSNSSRENIERQVMGMLRE